jgi:hypothetical protein
LVHGVEVGPRGCHRKELVLALACLCPGNALLQVMRVRLLDTVPIIFERLSLIPDKGEPAVLLSHRDTVGLGENTYQGQ